MSTLAILLLLFGVVAAGRDSTPVFILDFEKILAHVNIAPNPLKKIESSVFSMIIDSAIKLGEVVIVFVEESFCPEDISVKDKGGTPFYHLRQSLQEKQVKFLPSVAQPFETLKQKLHPLDLNTFYIDNSNKKLEIYNSRLKYFYVYFKDHINETRANALRRHDLSIREIYFVVRKIAKNPIIAFYTGKNNPITEENLNFKSLKTSGVTQQPGVVISSTGALFKFIGVYATTGSRRSMFSQIPLVAEETWKDQHLITRMAYTDFELEFNFDFKKERWMIESVMLLERGEEVGRTELRAGAPWSWSYTCSDPLVLINLRDGSSLTISHYQVQPFKNTYILRNEEEKPSGKDGRLQEPLDGLDNPSEWPKWPSDQPPTKAPADSPADSPADPPAEGGGSGTNKSRCFGPAVDCGPYFNAHILAGLMVTFFCLGILTYGVMSMFNCQSNDRYDDQHGKPLVIAFEGGAM